MSYFWIEKPISSPTHFLSLNFYEFEHCSELLLESWHRSSWELSGNIQTTDAEFGKLF